MAVSGSVMLGVGVLHSRVTTSSELVPAIVMIASIGIAAIVVLFIVLFEIGLHVRPECMGVNRVTCVENNKIYPTF